MDYNVQDMVNTAFGQVEYDFKQPKGVPNWIIGANVIGQQSIGANLLTGNPLRDLPSFCEGTDGVRRVHLIRRWLDYWG